jgi:hypothetical protein
VYGVRAHSTRSAALHPLERVARVLERWCGEEAHVTLNHTDCMGFAGMHMRGGHRRADAGS